MDQQNLAKFPDQVSPTLESLPAEVQLQICREMLRSEGPITLTPVEPYVSGFAFGSLGILRTSKHFSTMALSVMYGENCFHLGYGERDIQDDSFEGYHSQTDHIKALKRSPWENLRNVPRSRSYNYVSSVDCLDLISQTSSGQTFLKHLQFDFGYTARARTMDGVLLCILKRMRGLQSVDLKITQDWQDITEGPVKGSADDHLQWEEQKTRYFLIVIKEELSHIKKITMGLSEGEIFDHPAISNWMAHELKKRNEAWVPPLPSYKKFSRTVSPMSIVDAEVAKPVVQLDDEFSSKDHKQSLAQLENVYGVF